MIKDEISRMWNMKKVTVIPAVVSALGTIPTGFKKYVATIGIDMKVEHVQKTALFGTGRISRLVFGY